MILGGKSYVTLTQEKFWRFGFLGLCWVFQWLGVQLAFNSQEGEGWMFRSVWDSPTMKLSHILWDFWIYHMGQTFIFVMIFICPEFSECNYCVSGGKILYNLFMYSEFTRLAKNSQYVTIDSVTCGIWIVKVDHFAFIALESMLKEPFLLICPTLNIFIYPLL